MDRPQTEKSFQSQIVRLLRVTGWTTYHTHDSRRSAAGYPDLTCVHPEHGVIWLEVKTERGKTTAAQRDWLSKLCAAGGRAAVVRPSMWERIEIMARGGW